jgi:hypothetical protein
MTNPIVLALGLASLALYGQSQKAGDSSNAAPGKQVSLSVSVNALLGLVEGQMMDLVRAMPAGKHDFAPVAAIFSPSQKTEFAGVRTFGALAIHVAQATDWPRRSGERSRMSMRLP